jgi:hypothetical protein
MHWIKERILEYEARVSSHGCILTRVHCRLRSDGSMWYQSYEAEGTPPNGPYTLEIRFAEFLKRSVPNGAHAGWSEKDFDDDFNERLWKMNGKEVQLVTQ